MRPGGSQSRKWTSTELKTNKPRKISPGSTTSRLADRAVIALELGAHEHVATFIVKNQRSII
jgi:hypothetical protein